MDLHFQKIDHNRRGRVGFGGGDQFFQVGP
jgi:hypothetical protein